MRVRKCANNSDMEEGDAVRGKRKGVARGKHNHTIYTPLMIKQEFLFKEKDKSDGEI